MTTACIIQLCHFSDEKDKVKNYTKLYTCKIRLFPLERKKKRIIYNNSKISKNRKINMIE